MTAVPAISELILAEACAGRRAGHQRQRPDPRPRRPAGPIGDPRLIIAAGHFRNGVLLSAVTADAVVALLAGGETHQAWTPFNPGRLT